MLGNTHHNEVKITAKERLKNGPASATFISSL